MPSPAYALLSLPVTRPDRSGLTPATRWSRASAASAIGVARTTSMPSVRSTDVTVTPGADTGSGAPGRTTTIADTGREPRSPAAGPATAGVATRAVAATEAAATRSRRAF